MTYVTYYSMIEQGRRVYGEYHTDTLTPSHKNLRAVFGGTTVKLVMSDNWPVGIVIE